MCDGWGGGEGEHECIKIRVLQMSHIKEIIWFSASKDIEELFF